MAKAIHTAAVALLYLIAPLVLFLGLAATGAYSGQLFITNLMISILVLFGVFVALLLSLVWKSHAKALPLICSVSLIVASLWHFGQDQIRRYLYAAEILLTPNFEKKCVPAPGVALNGDTLQLCTTHDFGDYAVLVVKISGSYPIGRLINDINSRKFDPRSGSDELTKLGIWENSVVCQHLLSDYYLFEISECGIGQRYCGPLG
jgi:hypothetical protein